MTTNARIPTQPEEQIAEALTAIMSRYEDAREQIIAGHPPAVAPAGWSATVPVDLASVLPAPRPRRQGTAPAPVVPRRKRGTLAALLAWLRSDVRPAAPAPSWPC